MSQQIEAIEGRYGVAEWISAEPSDLRIDGVPRIEFGFNGKLPLHVELGSAMRVARELRSAGFNDRADSIDSIIKTMSVPRADQPRLIVRNSGAV